MSVTPDADLDLQPSGGDQVPVQSGDVGLGSRPAPKHQALHHHPLRAPAGGHGHHQQPVREWEEPGECGEGKGRRGRAQVGGKAPECLTPRRQSSGLLALPTGSALWGPSEAGVGGNSGVALGVPHPGLADSGPQAQEKELDFGNMLVNGRQTRMLVLLNDGNCTLHYRLFLQQSHPEAVGNGPLGTQALPPEGYGFTLVNRTMVWGQGLKLGASTC